jgi:hypothetical protein
MLNNTSYAAIQLHTLILANSEILELISNFALIGFDILACGAYTVADLRSNKDTLVHVVEFTAQDQFITIGRHSRLNRDTHPGVEGRQYWSDCCSAP